MATVLIVDDERTIVELLSTLLDDEGYGVVVAYDGREGWDRLATAKPDVILCDVMMPVLDGIALCRRLYADPVYRTIPLVFMSTVGLPQTARGCPYAAFLPKPFSVDGVLDTIARVLAHAGPPP